MENAFSPATSVVIVEALRTPIGSFNGALSSLPAATLGAAVLKELLTRTGLSGSDVREVIMGQVLTAGTGQNPARQAALQAGLPDATTAFLVNQVCGSGLRAVALGAQQILCGDDGVFLCGGQESMSQAPHCARLRAGLKMGDVSLVDTMIKDGLWETFNNYHMGVTAENVARAFGVSRQDQDAFALSSQLKAEEAQNKGYFDRELVPIVVPGRKGDVTVSQDEYPRKGATLEALSALRPSFDREGTITAGNASGMNDGAAAVVLMSEAEATRRGLTPLAKIVSWATAGVDPKMMGIGPVPASQKALKKAGWTVEDLDLIEANEAFAAQACAVTSEMGWDLGKVNIQGGGIALGHPIGASGARILVTLLHAMARTGGKRGLATLCIGGGMGIALCVER